MARRSIQRNSNFNPVDIPERTALIPSAGQARKILRRYEEDNNVVIAAAQKKKLDLYYKKQLNIRKLSNQKLAKDATTKAIEANPLATYSLHRRATRKQLAHKGENTKSVAQDLDKMEAMKKAGPVPVFSKLDRGTRYGSRAKVYFKKHLRDIGKVSRGKADLSELDTSSDDEY